MIVHKAPGHPRLYFSSVRLNPGVGWEPLFHDDREKAIEFPTREGLLAFMQTVAFCEHVFLSRRVKKRCE